MAGAADEFVFVDEFELRGRNDEERGGAPDKVVLWPDRVWINELKTKAGSHRTSQLRLYLDLAHHHLTYLTECR